MAEINVSSVTITSVRDEDVNMLEQHGIKKYDTYSVIQENGTTFLQVGGQNYKIFLSTKANSNSATIKINEELSYSVTVQKNTQQGGKAFKKYKGHAYKIRTGSRGGKYILVKGEKIYI